MNKECVVSLVCPIVQYFNNNKKKHEVIPYIIFPNLLLLPYKLTYYLLANKYTAI